MAISDDDLKKIWGAPRGGGHYEGLNYLFSDAAAQNPPGGYADQLRTAARAMLSGIPTTMIPDDRSAIIEGVTNNMIAHFEENPPTITVDYAAIAKAVNDDAARRQAE